MRIDHNRCKNALVSTHTLSSQVITIAEGGNLVLKDRQINAPQSHEVRVAVTHAGLNRADLLQRRGLYPAPANAPQDIPGLEFCGNVESVGDEVANTWLKKRVMGIVPGGAMAQHVLTDAAHIVEVPDALSDAHASAVPEAFITAYDACIAQARITRKSIVLIHGAAGGIGTAAIQVLKNYGATTIGTSRTAAKLEACRTLGLDHGITVSNAEFADEVKAIAPDGVDAIIDTVGASYLGQNLAAVKTTGHIVCLGLMGGAKVQFNMGSLLTKRVRMSGTVLRSRSKEEKAALTERFKKDLLPKFEDGNLRAVLAEVMPMRDIEKAHQLLEENKVVGKIVMAWD